MYCIFFVSIAFSQQAGNGVSDIDGNNYETVIIGTQEWMSENLTVTRYQNGDLILNLPASQWSTLTSGAWNYYEGDIQYDLEYGKLYNWYTVIDVRNVCPIGWRIPTANEFSILINYLGGGQIAGGKMKTIGTAQWNSPNTGATNISMFSGLPGGAINYDGSPNGSMGDWGNWWSSDEFNSNEGNYLNLRSFAELAGLSTHVKRNGMSLRCLSETLVELIEIGNPIREVIKITDLMGRETEYKPNTVLIYVYSDGTTEKVFKVEL